MTSQIYESKSIFAFDAVALWNLKTLESYLSSPSSQHLLTFERASIYASLILNLYVYIEGNMNHGLKNIHNTTPKNSILRDHIITQTKFNVHPFEVLKWLDIEYGSKTLDVVKSKYHEVFKYHGILRNLIAHGGRVYSDGLHEWGEETQVNIIEPVDQLKNIISFYQKNGLYQETQEGAGYITTLATPEVFNFFKLSCRQFVVDLINCQDSRYSKSIFWTFAYDYFDIEYPGASSF